LANIDLASLISQVALRDRTAFSKLYSTTAPKLFGVCLRILNDKADAEDVLQEVFVKIWHRAGGYAATGADPYGWLCAIARNHSIDRLRSRRPITQTVDEPGVDLEDDKPDPEASAVLQSEGRRIDRCMEELDRERASAVRDAYVEGLSYRELADRYDVPLNTMRTWLRRSLLKLRECLDR
jgi:RNA polymerase sigma-70 factor (ECF subfamily)